MNEVTFIIDEDVSFNMDTYTVAPDGDGWKVMKNGSRLYKKKYNTRKSAIQSANRKAGPGDTVIKETKGSGLLPSGFNDLNV